MLVGDLFKHWTYRIFSPVAREFGAPQVTTALTRGESDQSRTTKKSPSKIEGLKINSGGVLLSHAVSHAVPSALKSLTSVFGMGTGVTSLPSPPKTVNSTQQSAKFRY